MTTGKEKPKHIPPSRKRYEAGHPVVSVRISKEMREELQLVNATSGMSVADVLRVGLDKCKPATEQAFNRGYEYARSIYEVTCWCSGCDRGGLSIELSEEKEAAAELLYREGWYCRKCR